MRDMHIDNNDYKKVFQREFKGNIKLIPIADPHVGHQNSDILKLKEHLELIYETDECYTILLGDQTETATKTSVGMAMFEENLHIPEQLDIIYDLLRPLADKGKILGVLTGNHEYRVAQLIGINPTEMLAKSLGINYMGYSGFLDLKVGRQHYHIMAHHGVGGGMTNGSKVNSSERLGKVAKCDLYLSGHTHVRHYSEDQIYEIHRGQLVPHKKIYVTCGSFLNYWNGYAEMKALSPSVPGSICIELCSDRKCINVLM